MPLRTKLSAHQEPTPTTPKIITRFSAMQPIASSPNRSSALRNIACSIAIVQILGTKVQLYFEIAMRRTQKV
jgi:hypothetical protein